MSSTLPETNMTQVDEEEVLEVNVTQEVVSCCLWSPEDLAVDWLGRNLYWTDSERGVIEMARLDGGGRTVLRRDLDSPSALALDPHGG